jgi:hypothetical protein
MTGLLFEILFIAAIAALAVGIGATCLEMAIRLIGRGLGSQLSSESTMPQRVDHQIAFRL